MGVRPKPGDKVDQGYHVEPDGVDVMANPPHLTEGTCGRSREWWLALDHEWNAAIDVPQSRGHRCVVRWGTLPARISTCRAGVILQEIHSPFGILRGIDLFVAT